MDTEQAPKMKYMLMLLSNKIQCDGIICKQCSVLEEIKNNTTIKYGATPSNAAEFKCKSPEIVNW